MDACLKRQFKPFRYSLKAVLKLRGDPEIKSLVVFQDDRSERSNIRRLDDIAEGVKQQRGFCKVSGKDMVSLAIY